MKLKELTLEELNDLKVETLQQIENTKAEDAERIGLERVERINWFIRQKTKSIDRKRQEVFEQMMDVNEKIIKLQEFMSQEMEKYSKDIEEKLSPNTQRMLNKLNDIQKAIDKRNLEIVKLQGEMKILEELKKF